ncbi:MAG: SH3 domain-containing protein [Desulfobulbaceae bacterium]|nr:SH3 domain-containing protein [Desulfobulbaceae bacterium]
MRTRKKISALFKMTLAGLLCITSLAHAEERYLADGTTGALREGPGSQYKAIKTLQNDQSFEVLETLNGFVHIRTNEGAEGWVQEKLTSTKAPEMPRGGNSVEKVDTNPPEAKNITKLPVSSERFAAKESGASQEAPPRKESPELTNPRESTDIKKLQADLNEITEKFNQIEISTEDADQLKSENERLKGELSDLQKNLAQLQQANLALANKQNIYWFVAGGFVFLLGWLIGRVSFRRQRHSSLTL